MSDNLIEALILKTRNWIIDDADGEINLEHARILAEYAVDHVINLQAGYLYVDALKVLKEIPSIDLLIEALTTQQKLQEIELMENSNQQSVGGRGEDNETVPIEELIESFKF